MRLFWWIIGIGYLLISGIVTLALIAESKPITPSIFAGILWLPLLLYGLFTNRVMR